MQTWIKRSSLFAIFLFLTSFAAYGQDNAAMTGTVTDVTGAVIPGSTVTLTNPARGLKYTVTTNSEGSYRFPNVPPASGYNVVFSHAGFTSQEVTNITIAVANTRTQDAKLGVGANAVVEVAGKNALVTLNTTDASIGNNIDVELIDDLPIQSRTSPAALFILQPGVTSQGSVTGARTDQSSVTVDGMDVNDISTGQFGNTNGSLPVDATQEFRATVAGLPANVGTGGGGQFQLVTKSGTNKFHGDANEYHRDTITSSNTWFNNNSLPQVGRTPLIRNQFGGAIGGPILHDKLFVFLDFNTSRTISSASGADTVPLDSYRNGIVSYVKTGCSPTTSRQNTTPSCIGSLTPAQVQASDPAGKGEDAVFFGDPTKPGTSGLFNTRYPHANDLSGGDGVNSGLYRFTQGNRNILYNGVGRIDYNLTSKQRVFIQFHNAHQDSLQAINRFPTDPITRPFQDRSYGYVGSHIWQIGNNKVNQFYYGDNVTVFNFPLSYNPLGATIIGSLSGTFTTPYDGGNIQKRRVPIPTVRDDFNWTLGNHSISLGGTFKFIKASNYLGSDFNTYTLGLGGNVTTLSGTTGLRPADLQSTGTTNTAQFDNAYTLALGRVGRISSIYNFTASGAQLASGTGANRRFRYYQTEAYAGDSWRVNKELTLTYGLRYSYYSVPFETLGSESIPSTDFNTFFNARLAQSKAGIGGANSVGPTAVPLITYTLGGSVNNAKGYYAPNYKDFAPRFAFAYNPSYSPKTVINGSADIVYDRAVANAVNFFQNQNSYLFQNSTALNYGSSANPAGSLATDPRVGATGGGLTDLPAPPTIASPTTPYTPNINSSGQPTGLISSLSTYITDYNLKDPYSITFNFGIQQEFPGHFVLRASYAGRLGRRLLAGADAEQLIDFPDTQSGQMLSQAFAYLTTQSRQGTTPNNLTPQPFFEHIFPAGTYVGRSCGAAKCNSNTAFAAFNQSTYINRGDITDALQAYSSAGFLPTNVGIGSQFARALFITNKGSSSYNGLLVSLSKNMSQGIKGDINYTWSHSVDNYSLIANATGQICDVINPRACRANSDFDVTHVVTGDLVYQLPFGRGRQFGSNLPLYVDEAIGGWSISAIPTWQSGFAYTPTSNAFLASFAQTDPAIFDGIRSDDLSIHKNKDSANRLLAFKNPAAALAHFRGPIGIEYGSRNMLRGPSQLYLDAGVSKDFQLLPNNRLRLRFRADAYNVLNHPTFATPTADITSGNFGVISAQTNQTQRVGQFSLRLEF